MAGLSSFAVAGKLRITATVDKPHVGGNTVAIHVARENGTPASDASLRLSVGMTSMDMGTAHPPVTTEGEGLYTATVQFSMAGPWRITVEAEAAEDKGTQAFDFKVPGEHEGHGHGSMPMQARLGAWGMQREASGTSWIPDSSPMFMKMLPSLGGFETSLMGSITFNYSNTSGPRGDNRTYSNSMIMLMGRKDQGRGTLGYSLMASLDPVFNGEYGYPDLFQTGETAYGNKLTDYQHPHDLVSEAAVTYSHPIGNKARVFVYAAPVGEPALGGPTFMHRPSGMEIPEAPIGHHWFDSTHISWGVLTGGLNTDRWQIEGSWFNGHEPDENRYSPDPIGLNSASARLTFNPSKNWSLNASYGYLNSPESTEPGVGQHRVTAAAIWSQPLGERDNFSATAAWGQNVVEGQRSNSFLLEGTLLKGATSLFARWENVDKNELVGVPAGTYNVNKFLLGGVQNLTSKAGFDLGLGGYVGFYHFPGALEPYYGKSPLTLGVFVRVRPTRM